MKLHANASLTIKQRRELKMLYESGHSVKALVARFGIHETTVRRWINRESPEDRSSTPHRRQRVVTDEYRAAVIAYRKEHPEQGPIRIAQALAPLYPQANRGNILLILQQAGLTRPHQKKASRQVAASRTSPCSDGRTTTNDLTGVLETSRQRSVLPLTTLGMLPATI